jgi:uroporphyrinogen-III decarboxylase
VTQLDKEALFQERLARIKKAIAFEPVDRVPVVFNGPAYPPRHMGMSMAAYSTDPEAGRDVTLAFREDVQGLDGINGGYLFSPYLLNVAWLSSVKLPGRDLPENSLWQVSEAQVMSVEDYDTIIEKGWNAFVGEMLPRVTDMAEFGRVVGWIAANAGPSYQLFREHGYVCICGGQCNPPLEPICGARSMQQFIFDLHRMPDKVQAALDAALPEVIEAGIGQVKAAGTIGTWVGGWRSASAIMSPKLWNRFVWPYYVKIVDALLAADITPVLHWDQDWTRDLGRLNELPAKKVVLNVDGMTDARRFRELVGDRMAMMGDVPASLFAAGTPDDIYNYVRDLVRDIGPEGLILCPGCDAPINTRRENMEAFVAASLEYGKVTAIS